MMFFIYGLIAFLTLSIVAINIQPYKVASRYSLMDTVFYTLLSLVFLAAISRDIATMGKFFSIIFIEIIPLLTACIPIVYIATYISFWIISRMRRIR
jgi:hypothetical protein